MSEKRPLTEGHVKHIEKGANKPSNVSSPRPTKPPPSQKPKPKP